MDKLIKIEVKNHYGIDHYYVVSEHEEYIKALTGRKTITEGDMRAFKALGFQFEIEQKTINV